MRTVAGVATVLMVAAALVVGLLAARVVSGSLTSGVVPVSGVVSTHHIQEDDPGWDCRVDGNRVCGPVFP